FASFLFPCYAPLRDLHSFPTRRSSDLESAEALAAVDEIAAVDGVDLLFIGTNDLCSSLGIPGQLDHELVRDAYVRGIEACRRYGKHLGVGGLSAHPKLAGDFVKLGAR